MRRSRCCSVLLLMVFCSVTLMLASCGNGKKIGELGAKIKELENRGIPDSILANAHLDLENAKNGDKTGINIKEYLDSLQAHIDVAEKWSSSALQAGKGRIDAMMPDLMQKKAALSGAQLLVADSIFATAKEFEKKGWYLQEEQTLDKLKAALPGLQSDEELAQKAAVQIVGAWNYTEQEGKARHRIKVTFLKDGTFEMGESMNGETTPILREDWEYQTHGNYGIKGDTVNLVVNNEKLMHQTYWNLNDSTNQWKKREVQPYDSAISSGMKNRSFSFDFIKKNFRR